MTRKTVFFNYFDAILIPVQQAIMEEINEKHGTPKKYIGDIWNMDSLLDDLLTKNFKDTNINVDGEPAEIEPDSLTPPDNGIRSFQLSKLRDTNIPSKKRIGEIRQEIELQDDEYIGEFVSVIYDERYKVFMIQSNKYGLSIKQIEKYFTDLRFKYLEYKGVPLEEPPLVIKLRPIIDPSKIQKAFNAKFYRKIKIRGADFVADTTLNENGLLSMTRRLLYRTDGVTFDINISVGRGSQTSSLNDTVIREFLEEYSKLPEKTKPTVEISKKDEEDSEVEIINLIEPRMSDKLYLEIQPRTTIGHEFLYHEMKRIYEKRRAIIAQLIPSS